MESEPEAESEMVSELGVHRINRPSKQPPNKGLQNAAEAAKRNQVQKVLSRLNTFSLLGNLWVYPANGGRAKVIQHPMSKYTGISSIAASEALNAFTLELLSAYNGLQGNEMPGHGNLLAFITREKLCFSVQKDASTLSPLKPTGSLADMHSQLSRDNELSTKDAKSNSITLRAYVWQPKSRKRGREGIVHSDDDTDTDDNNDQGKDIGVPTSKWCIIERTHASHVSVSSVQQVATVRSSRITRRSVSSLSESSLGSVHSNKSLNMAPAAYVSAYQPALAGPSLIQPMSTLRFDAYPFRRSTCTTHEDDIVEVNHHSGIEIILVANDWPRHKYQESRQGGYLGKGLEKYAFRGRDKDTDIALFQMNPGWSKWPVSEEENERLLLQGLIALTTADYFMQSFHRRAIHYSVDLPSLQFNSKGAFLGVVETGKISPRPEVGPDHHTLSNYTFLATPLLPGDHRNLHKYSGSLVVGHNGNTGIGAAIDAFAHHVVVDSSRSVLVCDLQGFLIKEDFLLFDPQVRSSERISTADSVETTTVSLSATDAIKQFISEHVCNPICLALQLGPASSLSTVTALAPTKRTGPL
ncbi:kinase-like domain-containing protein [Gautieria morchelliformis]|nr:kinase-like domain-containing protein [Gautieria morchelliformis]